MLVSALVALATPALVAAQSVDPGNLKVTYPSKEFWWVNEGSNRVDWTGGNTGLQFGIFVSNDKLMAAGDLALTNIIDVYVYSYMLNALHFEPGPGYIVKLSNPVNASDIYAQSEPFEIKPLGAAYATGTNTGINAVAASTSGAASGTASGANSTASSASPSASDKSGASHITVAGSAVAAAVMGAVAYNLA